MSAPTPKFTNKLFDKKVLIVGGSTGVGRSVAHGVLEFGGIAIISSSSRDRINAAIADLKAAVPAAADRIYGAPIDLSTSDDLDARMTSLLEFAKQAHNGAAIDHVVFTAGDTVPINGVKDASASEISQVMQVRVVGAIFLVKHAPKYMTEGSGASVTLTTGNSMDKPGEGWALVAGLVGSSQVGLVKGFAVDLKPRRVNLISLGVTRTEILDKIGVKGEILDTLVEQTLTKKIALPEDVAEAYLYVMRDRAVTGQTITTDGGRILA